MSVATRRQLEQPDFTWQSTGAEGFLAAVSASIRKQIEAARLQKAEGRSHNSECSFEQADRIVQAAKGRRRSGECIYEKANRISETSEGRRRKA